MVEFLNGLEPEVLYKGVEVSYLLLATPIVIKFLKRWRRVGPRFLMGLLQTLMQKPNRYNRYEDLRKQSHANVCEGSWSERLFNCESVFDGRDDNNEWNDVWDDNDGWDDDSPDD